MPPRVAKKTPPGPGTKRATRATRATPDSQTRAEVVQEAVKVEVATQPKIEEVKSETEADGKPQPQAQAKPEPEVKEKQEPKPESDPEMEANPEPGSELKTEAKSEENCSKTPKKEDEVKESVDKYEKDERLDLEDNEPDYDPEEYVGVDYDEKEMEQENVHEEGDEIGDEAEGDVVEEEEADMVEEEAEDERQEFVGKEYEEHGTEDHTRMVYAEEEHHEVVKERRKRKEFEVFVGGLDKDATEDDLKKVFSQVGEVIEVRLMMNSQTKKNKGFAFLRFATIEQAKRACAELKHPMINGKKCGVTPSQDSDTLFLGNICKTWTKEALKEKLKHYGVENIEDLSLVEDSNYEGMNRGFAFLEFSSRSEAMDAFKRLQRRDIVFGVDRPAKVSFADSIVDPGDEIMAQVKTVFVDGLSASWDEARVRKLLKKYGEIEKIELARNMPSARRKDFGFITFDTHDAAVTCARSINNEELGEGNSKAKVRARLSRPLQKGRGKHVGRGDFRSSRGAISGGRGPWVRPLPRSLPVRAVRGTGGRMPPIDHGLRRPAGFRDKRPVMAMPPRSRPLPPLSRSYDRRPPVPSYTESSLRRDYGLREEVPMRSRAAADFGSRVTSDRQTTYRDDYSSHGSGFPPMPRDGSRTTARRPYVDDGYSQRFERHAPSYREGRGHDYDNISGSKRPYAALDDVPPRYSETGVRQSRARLDYELGGSGSQYRDAYSDRFGRPNLSYGGSRSSIGGQDSHGLYSSRHGMGYGGGSYGGSDIGGIYSSSFGGEDMPRGGDVGGSSYSSFYTSRGLGGSSYMGSGGSGGYY